ncbi:hypothetical protein FPE01S_02_09110 [Flavihumibacter petaseus NBRC 106054]|uniref:PKD/Chitinase domain-containing protein n=2 Tax=Flavihumibacter TaxID=1004301 RepID=A0A0E9N368_9BACT|nr:hypothetical protein FPE01S_02_09110 [Flavihumibacter petaseus NBRC 106054]
MTPFNKYQESPEKKFPVEQAVGYTDRVRADNAYVVTGAKSARFELNTTDPQSNVGNHRSEIVPYENAAGVWYEWTSTLDPNNWADDAQEEVIAQWHERSASCSASPMLSLETKFYQGAQQFRIMTRYSDADYCANNGAARKERAPVYIGQITKGVLIRWIVYYKVGFAGDGEIQIWRDHVPGEANPLKMVSVYHLENATTAYQGMNAATYWKLGIYKWVWDRPSYGGSTSTKRVQWIDDLKVYGAATTKEELMPSGSGNLYPIANVGSPATVAGGTSIFARTVSDSDPDGSVVYRKWTRISGPNTPLLSSGSTSQTLSLENLVPGDYLYRYTVVDNAGDTTFATLPINVGSSGNAAPAVTVTPLPGAIKNTNGQLLLQSDGGTDSDGTIQNILWEKISGEPVNIISPGSASTQVSLLKPGYYVFQVTVTDDKGAVASRQVSLRITDNSAIKISGRGVFKML